jgi:hypothetical protein
MAYSFNYDFTKLPKEFSKDIAKIVGKKELHRKLGSISRKLVKKFKIDKTLGIQLTDAISVVEDLIDINIKNLLNEKDFKKAKKKILLLPHCSRKYMDSRCKAKFDPKVSSYFCAGCSKDCLVNKATKIAKKKGYKVFVLPGGSCIKKILQKKECEAILGVACPEEIKLGSEILENLGMVYKGLPLIKNGCASTKFNIESLKEVLV